MITNIPKLIWKTCIPKAIKGQRGLKTYKSTSARICLLPWKLKLGRTSKTHITFHDIYYRIFKAKPVVPDFSK